MQQNTSSSDASKKSNYKNIRYKWHTVVRLVFFRIYDYSLNIVTEKGEDFKRSAAAGGSTEMIVGLSQLPTWICCVLILHYGHQSKNKVSKDVMTLLRKEHDISPSGLNLIYDKYPHTTKSLMFRVQTEVLMKEPFDLRSLAILRLLFKAIFLFCIP